MLHDTCQRVTFFLKARHQTSWKSESAPPPPVCVVGVGEGVGSDPNLSHVLLVWISFRNQDHASN